MSVSLPGRAPDFSIVWPADGTYGEGDPLPIGSGVELLVDTSSGDTASYVIGTDSFGKYLTSPGLRTSLSAMVPPTRDDLVDAVVARFRASTETPITGRILTASGTFRHPFSAASDITKMTFPPSAPPVHRSEAYAGGVRAVQPETAPSTHYREIRARVSAENLSVEWLDPTIGPGTGEFVVEPHGSPLTLHFNEPGTLLVTESTKIYGFDLWNELEQAATGMWSVRQRQTLTGNAGGWPLRQRQNAGATGTWPLRQRQNGT